MGPKKPLKINNGGYHTDSNFDTVMLTKTQVNKIARESLKRHKRFGCSVATVLDCDTHWAISIY